MQQLAPGACLKCIAIFVTLSNQAMTMVATAALTRLRLSIYSQNNGTAAADSQAPTSTVVMNDTDPFSAQIPPPPPNVNTLF